jgi:predicted RNA-binding Zn-ribbon protein involved in translation (DUF1610 family)
MTTRIPLKVVAAPAAGAILKAPPVLKASEHSVDFTCGRCGAVLLHADEGQVHGILIRCTNCESTIQRMDKPPQLAAFLIPV